MNSSATNPTRLRLTRCSGSDSSTPFCTSCSKLDITADKFLSTTGTYSTSILEDARGSSLGMRVVGCLDEIYARQESCSFCRLVYRATYSADGIKICPDGRTFDGKSIICQMDWQLDGRISREKDKSQDDKEQPAEARVLTRRLRLFNPQNAFPELCIVLLSKHNENRPSPTFLGRKIGRSHADVARMRQWIDTCENHHGTLCQSLDDSSLFDPISGSQGILRFLDLDQKCLVTATPEMKHATLSYIWGGQLPFRLVRNSLHSLS